MTPLSLILVFYSGRLWAPSCPSLYITTTAQRLWTHHAWTRTGVRNGAHTCWSQKRSTPSNSIVFVSPRDKL